MAAGSDQRTKQVYTFGPFRVDAEKELLFRGDENVAIAPKTFQVLLVLMRHKREVVTKDELLKSVWPDTFVEEANLSRNIFLLRKALGEGPQDHQYIVTVPGRGYRFAEDVQLLPEQELDIVSASHARVQIELKETSRWRWLAVVAGVLLALAVGSAGFFFFRHRSALSAKDTIVLADFANSTGDPVFDGTLRQGLAVELEQSPFLTLVSDQRIQQTLRLMGQPPDARITPQIASDLCQRTQSAAYLTGSIVSLGSQYVLGLKAVSCPSGDILAEEQETASGKEQILEGLDKAAGKLRKKLGESLSTVEKFDTPLEQATTPSLDALKAYSAARSTILTHGGPAAIPDLQRAIAIDPQFAMAYADLSISYWNMGQTDLSSGYTLKAYELRDRVSDRERLWILFLYDRQVTGNLPRELQTLESWVQRYPRDWIAYAVMAGWGTLGTGQYEMGIQAGKEALRLNPDAAYSYAFAQHYLFLNRFPEAADIMQRAASRNLEIPEMLIFRYYLAFLNGDPAGMEREITRAPGEHAEDWMSHNQALVLARSGQMRQARSMWERAVAMAEQAGNREGAARYEAAEAVCEALFGNNEAAKGRVQAALKLAKDRDVEYAAAFALALSGDSSEAQRLGGDLEKRFPEDTPVQFEYLPTLRALFALAHQAPLDAAEQLQKALPYDFALPGTAFFAKFGGLYPAYVRGEAYMRAGKGKEAAAEFQKILDHRGVVLADPVGALAHLQLGRAYVLMGDNAKAKTAYQDFLALWKDADTDIPILQQARAEYVKLQ
jgi:DNA-binding winged helix-turn-helix (wHTH) protein/tetratricopeptide (TPR) repeat protein